jgi:Anti-sigma factor NepR
LDGQKRGRSHCTIGKSGDWGATEMTSGKTVNLQPPAPDADKADEMGKPATQRKSEVRLGREVQARIGQQLRAMYDDVVSQGVPPHIADLVRRLSDQDDGAA